MIACCLPLTLATFLGYWFMKALGIGLTVATLPVMVLAVGIGVDYAFYIYSRLQMHLARGEEIVTAFKQSLSEVGIATIFTAITLSIRRGNVVLFRTQISGGHGNAAGCSLFMINMLMAITLLPALAVMLDVLIPRRRRVALRL